MGTLRAGQCSKGIEKNAALPQKADEKTEMTNRQKTKETQQTTPVVFEYRLTYTRTTNTCQIVIRFTVGMNGAMLQQVFCS